MSRKATKPIVLALIFICALFTFSLLMNKENKEQTITMDSASLPVMQFVYKDMVINELHGYTNEMEMLSMRDGLMPLNDSRQLLLRGKYIRSIRILRLRAYRAEPFQQRPYR